MLSTCPTLTATEFFVATHGNDNNPGTKNSPFASLEAARDAVRKRISGGMQDDVFVHIGPGNFFVQKPIEFDDRDSGRDGHVITYKGAPNLGTRIYGGRRLTGWKKLNDHEFELNIPDLKQHFTLYENELAANGGLFHTFRELTEGNWRKDKSRLIYHPRNLPVDDQVIVLGTAKDVFLVKGRSMEQIAKNIVFDGLYLIGSDFASSWKKGATYSTTWHGEYDGRTWNGQTLCDAVLAPDMRHGQFYVENARNVVICNSKLYGAGFMGVIFNRWSQDNRVENCWIENAGCNGLFFMGWECGRGPFKTVTESYVNKKNIVRNNVFHDIGRFAEDGAGIYFCFSGDNLVEHNVFHGIRRYGVATKGWRPRLLNQFHCVNRDFKLKDQSKIEPYGVNEITFYDDYVVTEANQGAELQHSRNNLIRYNDLSQIPRDGSDMGMIEMWGAGTGNRWEFNACHDGVNCGGWDDWLHVLFNDDGSHNATLRGNIIYWIAGGGRSRAIMLKGNDQLNSHNIIADCELDGAATIGPFTEPAHNMTWSHNIVAAQIRRLYEGGAGHEVANGVRHPILKEAARNLYFYKPLGNVTASADEHARLRLQIENARKSTKLEADSIYTDPLFDRKRPWWDSSYFDYRLLPESPAHQLAFDETDMTKIGLRAGYPFKLTDVFDHPAGNTWKAANFSRIYKNRIIGGQVRPRSGISLFKGSWTRYSNVDFGEGRHTLFRSRLSGIPTKQTFDEKDMPIQPEQATAVEVRLDAPDGKLIGELRLGQSTCPIERTKGRHDLFLVFPNENIESMDWFRFE